MPTRKQQHHIFHTDQLHSCINSCLWWVHPQVTPALLLWEKECVPHHHNQNLSPWTVIQPWTPVQPPPGRRGENNTSLKSNKTIFDFNPMHRIISHCWYTTTVLEEGTPKQAVLKRSRCTPQPSSVHFNVSKDVHTKISGIGPQPSGSWDTPSKLSWGVLCTPLRPRSQGMHEWLPTELQLTKIQYTKIPSEGQCGQNDIFWYQQNCTEKGKDGACP